VDDKRLVIAGKGPQQTEVEAIAQRNTHIEYRGYLETNELVDIVSRAEATIFAAQTESFGLVTIESMAAGTPVIGVESGFTKYQIIEGKTGVMFNQFDNLPMIINQWDGVTYDASQLRRYIRPSSRGTFERKLKDVIQRVTAKAQITSHFEEV
jgi:glycosyltransferase involved in cell wall biosynthesis